MKNRLHFTIIFTLLGLSLLSQSAPQYATARVFESNIAEASRILLVYETGDSEIIPLKNFKILSNAASANQVMIENQKTINQVMNDMKKKGYDVTGITSNAESGYFYSFIVFSKKEEK